MEENRNLHGQEETQKKTAADYILEKLKKDSNDKLQDYKELHEQISSQAIKEENIEDVDEAQRDVEENYDDLETENYFEISMEQLVEEFEKLVNNLNETNVKKAERIRNIYHTRRNKQIQEKQLHASETKTTEPEEDTLHKKFKEIHERYKALKNEINQRKEAKLQRNTERKFEIINAIEQIVEKGEYNKNVVEEFRKLREEWEQIEEIDPKKQKELNEKYEQALQKFYSWKKISEELRELDFRKNYEQKIKLCEEAEALLIEPKIVRAYKKLQILKQRWSNIGPVPKEHREDLLNRFKEVEKIINKRYYEYFQEIRKQQQENLKAKELLCEEAEKIANGEYNTSAEWKKKNEELDELLKLWKMIGFAPKKYNNSIFERFIAARKKFFEAKREFFSKYFSNLEENYNRKLELVKIAEENKDRTDFDEATKIYIDIQNKWKEIGPVPNAKKDEIWKRFNDACNYFFERKRQAQNTKYQEELNNLKLKQEILDQLRKFEIQGTPEESLKQLQELQKKWLEIGHVPLKEKNKLNEEYRKVLDQIYEKLNVQKDSVSVQESSEQRIAKLLNSDNAKKKLRTEIDRIKNKIDNINNDIIKLENNMRFFVKTQTAEGILKNFKEKIDRLNDSKADYEKYLQMLIKAYRELQ